jgi:hypothetical protein
MLKQFGISTLIHEGVEADDVMGTLARRYGHDMHVVLVTGDKDAYQLVGPQVHIYARQREFQNYAWYDRDAVIASGTASGTDHRLHGPGWRQCRQYSRRQGHRAENRLVAYAAIWFA